MRRLIFPRDRSLIYWGPLAVFWLVWLAILGFDNIVPVFETYWRSSVTMIAGSFVAGATPLGGGAVAFPVLTKVLHVDSLDASIFSLFIQSVGMTFATLYFISRKINIDWHVIKYASIGSFLSLPFGLAFVALDNTTIRFIFSEFIIFCAFMILWDRRHSKEKNDISVYWPIAFGFAGGLLTAKIGSGCDAILYFYLVFVCRGCIRRSIPTTVCFMAINSIYASAWLLMMIEPSDFVVGSWWSSAPVVSLGAPLGAFVLSKLKMGQTISLVVTIICLEVATTLMFVPFSLFDKVTILITVGILSLYTRWDLTRAKRVGLMSGQP
ncbi:MAG: sulfite exporter TauE/SafE family protein [Gammaproteobacteria bacterium]|nr:sulfite exporter TauE/SafE family protein [Gammaproteobacteria bacterium]MDH5800424.1 sulfite exporter TauE/SafE family protein [Gammaproteobacteria bacterium]